MANLALYRKYRPQSFASVIGQDTIKNTLMSMNIDGHINHGFIFSGPKGTGKTTIAKIFAKAINCLQPINGDACNECENCLAINNNSAIDILELDAASNNGVDEIRSIIDNVMYLPISLKYKVYIIDEAHMLTTGAWNALLKTLEEPPGHVVFILATTEYNKIPATIVSRCQRYDFHRLTTKQLEQLINQVCEQEKIKIDNDACKEIALLADGAGRDALSILSQLAVYTNNEINIEAINKVFNVTNLHEIINLINLLNFNKIDDILKMLKDYDINGINWTIFTTNFINICMDKYLLSLHTDPNLLTTNKELLDKIEMKGSNCLKLANILSETLINLKTSINPFITFQLSCLNFINQKDDGLYTEKTTLSNNLEFNLDNNLNKNKTFNKTNAKLETNNQVQNKNECQPVPETLNETHSLDNLFVTKTRNDLSNQPVNKSIPKTNNQEKQNVKPNNPYDILKQTSESTSDECHNEITQEAFNVIVNNNDKEIVKKQQLMLDEYLIQNEFDLSKYIRILKEISKIWVATSQASILAFPSFNGVQDFNHLLGDDKFIEILTKIFGENKVLFAIDNIMRDNMKEAYLNAKSTKSIPNQIVTDNFITTHNGKISLQEKIKKLLE